MAGMNVGESSRGCGSCSDEDVYRLAWKLLALNPFGGGEVLQASAIGSTVGPPTQKRSGSSSYSDSSDSLSFKHLTNRERRFQSSFSSRSTSSQFSSCSNSAYFDDSSVSSDGFSASLNGYSSAIGDDHDSYSIEPLTYSSYPVGSSSNSDYDCLSPTSTNHSDLDLLLADDSISCTNRMTSVGETGKLESALSQLNLQDDLISEYHCHYCFKRIYTLAIKIANKNGQPTNDDFDNSPVGKSRISDILVTGSGIRRAMRGRSSLFYIIINERSPVSRTSIANSLVVNIIDPNGYPCDIKVKPISGKKIAVRYKPDFEGIYEAMVSVDMEPIKGSPFNIEVSSHHRYQYCGKIKSIIPGDERGHWSLNDPWGICCNSDGYIFVGDRGNHTIKVFKPNLEYSHSIGSKGSKAGQLNKPAGVTTNSTNEIIVADKDNHRIQVFDFHGQVTLVIGQYGHSEWQLNYPWDVTVGPNDFIFVSDSRNGRISLFASSGTFIRCFDLDNNVLKSPRGICYREIDGRVIASDMNRNQIVVIDVSNESTSSSSGLPHSLHPTLIGSKGSEPNELHRPQGVTCDPEGNVVVSDSRNCRMQVFDADGNYLCHWSLDDSLSSNPIQPMGVVVTPDGNVLVVDSEHNRILVF